MKGDGAEQGAMMRFSKIITCHQRCLYISIDTDSSLRVYGYGARIAMRSRRESVEPKHGVLRNLVCNAVFSYFYSTLSSPSLQ